MDVSKVKTIKGRTPLRASSAIRSAERSRGKSPGSLNFVYCPKIDRDFVFPSDLEFLHALHLEADEGIASYEPDPERIIQRLGEDGVVGSKPDAICTTRNGQQCMVEVKYQKDLELDLRAKMQVQAQCQAAADLGWDWRSYTDHDALAEQRLLNDWLQIIVLLGFSRGRVSRALQQQVLECLQKQGRLNLMTIQEAGIDDWLLVFSAIFQLIQKGRLASDLRDQPLGPLTLIWATK